MRAIFVAIAIFSFVAAQSQSGWERADKRAFDDAEFALYQGDVTYALEVFQKLYEKHPEHPTLSLRLGTCLLNSGKDAEQAGARILFALDEGEKEAWFEYGRYLHHEYQFDAAINHFSQYLQFEKREVGNEKVERLIKMCIRAQRMIVNPVDIKITNIGPGVNTENKEYVPVVTGDGKELYFTSRRNDSTAQLKDDNGAYFEDIYVSNKTENGWNPARNVGPPINSETHDATVAISSDGSSMIIYRTNKNLTGGDLWISHKANAKWSSPKKLGPEINSDYQEASACLSANGKTLIFSSNRPGGMGGKDLYRVRKLPNGSWSLPKNLGPVINSQYDEDAPFLDIDSRTLYFASNGHETMGGYDIFTSSLLDDDLWSVPENLGYPLNTVEDDIYLVVTPGGKTGYYSSRKNNGFGELDIYEVDFVYRKNRVMVIKGEVMDLQGNPVQAKITLLDDTRKEIQGVYNTHPASGKFIMILNPLTVYKVFIEAEGFRTQQDELFFVFPNEGELDFRIAPYILTP